MGIHDGHRQRLKQEFLDQGTNMHTHKLLELLLCYCIPQGDTNPLAHSLLERFGSLSGVFDALPENLTQVPGVGEHSSVLFRLIPVLFNRVQRERTSHGDVLNTSQAARNYLNPYFSEGVRNEMVYLVCLDSKCKVLGCHKISEGSVNAADITLRKVVELLLNHNATGAILAHNHVGSLALPSDEDLHTTKRLFTVLREVGVTLMDHLIFADDDMVSLKDSGLLGK